MTATTVMLAAVWSCGDNGGTTPPDNQDPTAEFTSECSGLTCAFTNNSRDPDEGTTLTYSWNFGEAGSPTNTSTETSPSHTYAAAGTYTVSLTANDGEGGTGTQTAQVTVSGPVGPTASFTVTCNGPDCSFTNTSTGTEPLTYAWNFGEPASGPNNTSTQESPTHSYTVTEVTPFTVTLTVTDAQSQTATTSQDITITPAAGLECESGGTLVSCTLDMEQRATLTFTLVSEDCELGGNRFAVVSPVRRTIFTNGCSQQPGTQYPVTDQGTPIVFEAGTQIQTQFTQGAGDPDDPPRGAAAVRLSGEYPNWTITIDDGGNPTAPGEPDFNDIVLSATATPQ